MSFSTKIVLFLSTLSLCLASAGLAEMSSTSYTLSTSVMGGGGGASASGHYVCTSTIGQPTPVVVCGCMQGSGLYNFPGFWNRLYVIAPEVDGFLPGVYLLLMD